VTPAAAYERYLVPTIFGPWARHVVEAHPPAPGSTVLDVACGTGIGARSAAARVAPAGLVVGVDADAQMLAVARSSAARIHWLHADALNLPLQAREFDYLLCLEGLQFFPDRPAGLGELRRVLRPDGALVGTVWGPLEQNPAYHAVAEGLRRFVSEEAGRLPPFALSDADTIRSLLRSAGFRDISVSIESVPVAVPSGEAFVAWTAAGGPTIRHNLAQLKDDRRREFDEFVAARLSPYRAGDGLSLPSTRHILVAR
jgi:SAM-dependent methyltransferase